MRFVGFRRITPQAIHVCDIQREKYGRPRFAINFGQCGPAGAICHGQPVGGRTTKEPDTT
jgi:hypothetical protein